MLQIQAEVDQNKLICIDNEVIIQDQFKSQNIISTHRF
jgi:hypothetical protein